MMLAADIYEEGEGVTSLFGRLHARVGRNLNPVDPSSRNPCVLWNRDSGLGLLSPLSPLVADSDSQQPVSLSHCVPEVAVDRSATLQASA